MVKGSCNPGFERDDGGSGDSSNLAAGGDGVGTLRPRCRGRSPGSAAKRGRCFSTARSRLCAESFGPALPGRASQTVSKFTIGSYLQIFGQSGTFAPSGLGAKALPHRRWLPAGRAAGLGAAGRGRPRRIPPGPAAAAGPAGLARSQRDPRSPAASAARTCPGWRPADRGGEFGGRGGSSARLLGGDRPGRPAVSGGHRRYRARRSCPACTEQPESGHLRAASFPARIEQGVRLHVAPVYGPQPPQELRLKASVRAG
ncbi:pulmonary surfactant-associated protein D-like [Serinus canaria]|uniref:pulmonary surfactant-associated protein D-like n=1 Tax=Serinus canaria TaxID=9135 RepID=UPI0021CC6A3D|nr:pulmonary surfactant-associated protein D-like [Serinus canaria]